MSDDEFNKRFCEVLTAVIGIVVALAVCAAIGVKWGVDYGVGSVIVWGIGMVGLLDRIQRRIGK